MTSWWRPGTDIVVEQGFDGAVPLHTAIPDDASVGAVVSADWAPIETAGGQVVWNVAIEDPGDALPARVVEVSDGRMPRSGAGEVWLSAPLADELGVGVGDPLELVHPAGSWTVVGTGRMTREYARASMIVPDLVTEQFTDGMLQRITLIDLPAGTTGDEVAAAGQHVTDLVAAAVGGDDGRTPLVTWRGMDDVDTTSDAAPLAWGWVAGAIALAVVGIIVAAAFATSARRQLVTIGQLSANGASERLIRRSLALQGLWTGSAGSVLGAAVAVGALLAGHSTLERLNGGAIPSYRFVAVDLAVIVVTGVAAATVAALVPARSASRVPVLAALAGRRPLGVVPRRLVPVGLTAFAFGVFLLFLGASVDGGGNAAAAAAVLGGLLALGGVCCCSPLATDVMSRAGATVGGSWRFAGRSLGRTRVRSAAVVTAIAVTAALGSAGAALAMNYGDDSAGRQLPTDAVVLDPAVNWTDVETTADFEALPNAPLDEPAQEQLETILPEATIHPRRVATWDPPAGDESQPDPAVVIADTAIIELYELTSAERRALDERGALLLQPWGTADPASEERTIVTETGTVILPFALRDHVSQALAEPRGQPAFDGVYGVDALMITEEAARRLGFEIVESGAVVRNGAPLTAGQRQSLSGQFQVDTPMSAWYRDASPQDASAAWWVLVDWPIAWEPTTTALQAGVLVAVLALTLLVVAIGLSLAAAESRDERDVLVAVGARPRTLRVMAGAKAIVLTVTGVALAVPAGLIPAFAVTRAVDAPFRTPWLALAGLIVGLPMCAGVAAWVVSSVAQAVRPVRMSNVAVD